MNKYFLWASSLVVSLLVVTSCSSPGEKYFSKVIIKNNSKTQETPAWVLNTDVYSEEKGMITIFYKIDSLDGGTRPDACLLMAQTKVFGELMKSIKNSVTASGDVSEADLTSDPSYSALTAFLSQGNLTGVQITSKYWELTMDTDKTKNSSVKKLMCAVKASIEKTKLDKQMSDAINGASGGNPEVRQKLLDAQKNFIDNVGNSNAKK